MSSKGAEKRGSAATVRACDNCRRRKRRCQWAVGAHSCTPCIQIKEECATTHVRKPRSRPQKVDRIAEYELRIQRLEALLRERSESQPHVEEQPLQRAQDTIPLTALVDDVRNEAASFPTTESMNVNPQVYEGGFGPIDALRVLPETGNDVAPSERFQMPQEPDQSGNAGADNISDDLFDEVFEPSAEFLESAAVLQDPLFQPSLDIATTLQDSSYQPTVDTTGLNVTELPQALLEMRSACDAALPPVELGTSLLAEFLVDWNTVHPLYRPYVIAEHLRLCYAGNSDGTALAWASVYVVFGLAHRSRAMSLVAAPQDNMLADYYIAKTFPAVSGLLLAPPSLGLVQCLLGLAMLIQTSSYATPHAIFVSTALRMAQNLAYNEDHQTHADVGASYEDIEQQRRVFWLAFIQDTLESVLSNAPTSHRREDITTNIPEENPADSLGAVKAAEGNWRVNLFSLRARLALMQAWAIEQVLSLKARNQTPEQVHGILERLNAWHSHQLFQLSAAELAQLLYRSDLLHVLTVEASYFAIVFRLHAFLALGMDVRTNPFSAPALHRLSGQREQAAFKDAQRLLSLLAIAPQGDVGVCWATKLPVIAALVTVLSHHVNCPTASAPSADDMREYSRVLRMLGVLLEKRPDFEIQKMRDLCMELFSRLEAGLRVSWLDNVVANGGIGIG